jgi:ribonuclease HII
MEEKINPQNLRIIGIDEAGRGPLAGPVFAGAVKIKETFREKNPKIKICDSKKMTKKEREEAYQIITKSKDVEWGVGSVSEKVIDKINILEATKLAMKKAVEKINCKKAILLIDGNFKINMEQKQQSVIRGDEKILECSMASIIAKVERDRLMEKYHKKYPQYGFDSHKGYGTKKHFEAIRKYGLCDIHRKSFRTTH